MRVKFLHLTIAVLTKVAICVGFRPIVIWHSLGENCCGEEVKSYSEILRKQLESDIYIKSIRIGMTANTDLVAGFTMHPFDQIKIACDELKNDTFLRDGYNAIGFSQGALLLRGLAEVCPFPAMKNLVSMGGPHQGVLKYPRCDNDQGFRCRTINSALNLGAYRKFNQKHVAPVTYFHDLDDARYKAGSTFLAVINNENEINSDYVKNLEALEKLVLVKYEEDIWIIPKESSWFGYFDKQSNIVPLVNLDIYKSDRLGLKSMNENGKLIFLAAPKDHLSKDDEPWFEENIVPYFRN